MHMAWLALGGMLCSLQLNTGSFPRPQSQKEERQYLERAAQIMEICAKFQEAGMPLPFDNPFK